MEATFAVVIRNFPDFIQRCSKLTPDDPSYAIFHHFHERYAKYISTQGASTAWLTEQRDLFRQHLITNNVISLQSNAYVKSAANLSSAMNWPMVSHRTLPCVLALIVTIAIHVRSAPRPIAS